jgi:integrase
MTARAEHTPESPQMLSISPETSPERLLIRGHRKQATYHEQVWNYYEFQFFSGLRTGEVIGLEWAQVDLKECTVFVKKAFVDDRMADTKTSKERTVHLNSRH